MSGIFRRTKPIDVNLRTQISNELVDQIEEVCALYVAHDPKAIHMIGVAQLLLDRMRGSIQIAIETDKELERIISEAKNRDIPADTKRKDEVARK